ncbi:MAG: hypothetical protein JSW11_13860 [Candidatus Heimdallarchaeota archaeon]|nr:MAG: hypothetical protein JSW11_13860 [Candidatus Heimdallarchaeota archaeon]
MTEDQYRKIITDEVQKKIIDEFATIISEKITLKKMVIKGFLWQALRKWQETHEMTILETEKGGGSSPEERIKQASEILDICFNEMRYSVKSEVEALKTGIDEAIQHYTRNYAER